jgi:hypothetical protein
VAKATQETWALLNLHKMCERNDRGDEEKVAQPMLAVVVVVLLVVASVYTGSLQPWCWHPWRRLVDMMSWAAAASTGRNVCANLMPMNSARVRETATGHFFSIKIKINK